MCLLTEAIRIEKRKLFNLEYHQARFDKARLELLGLNERIKLSEAIKLPDDITDEVYKCKIIYSSKIHSIEFILYNKKLPKTIRLVHDNEIDYSYKYENRDRLKELLQNSGANEILIVKNGMITDTSRSNIVLKRKDLFITPASFLLDGTMRRFMLDKKMIQEEIITVSELHQCEKLYLINAMLDIDNQPGFPVQQIIF